MSPLVFKIDLRRACLLACACLLIGNAGCTLFRNAGTGAHYDAPRDLPAHKPAKKRDMLVEVTTDAMGAVTSVTFKRSSGAETVDSFVAESIRKNWPSVPSTVTLAELTYTLADGFSQPRMISSHPAP